MSTFRGTGNDDTLTGSSGDDNFLLWRGGSDTVDGGGGNDIFRMAAALDAGDKLDGGTGKDFVVLNGDYSAGLVFHADTITNIEVMGLIGGHSYNLTLNDGNVAAGAGLLVKAGSLGAGDSLIFDGSAEMDGKFAIIAGAGNDTLTGGARHDVFYLSSGGNDTVHGGGGNDLFVMGAAFTSGDIIDGGTGSNTIALKGDYSGGLAIGATMMTGVGTITLAAGNSYALSLNGDTIAPGASLAIDGSALAAGQHFSFGFDTTGGGDATYTLTGGAGNDTFSMLDAFSASDKIDGGSGGNDTLSIFGDYSAGVTFNADTIQNIRLFKVGPDNNYSLTENDGNVAAGATMIVSADALSGGGNYLHFDGSAETDGSFNITGGDDNDVLTGGAQGDMFDLTNGGNDTVHGGGGNDSFNFGFTLGAADTVDGGAGIDSVDLTGSYTLTFGATTMTNVESLALSGNFSYNLTTNDATVAAGQQLSVEASGLTAGHAVIFNGSAETDGSFSIFTGAGNDVLSGGQLGDTFTLEFFGDGGGTDTVHGNGGDDMIFAGASLGASDVIDGGSGTDTVELIGDYSGGVTLGAGTLVSIETLLVSTGAGLASNFSYKLTSVDANVAAGQTLTVDASGLHSTETLTFNGSAETNGAFTFKGGAGDDLLTGGAQNDGFNLTQGGNDTANGGVGNDTFSFGDAFTAADTIDGGANSDAISLNGDYSAGLTLAATTIANVESIVVAAGHSYNLTTVDANVAAGATLNVIATALGAADVLTFDGSAETDGHFNLQGGAGADVLEGSNLGDTFTGGAGADTFVYTGAGQSSSTTYDTVTDFASGTDHFDLTTTVTSVSTISGSLDSGANFDSELGALPGVITAGGAMVITVTGGTLINHTFLVVDGNGDDIYTAGQDYVFDITNHTGTITTGDFI